MKKKSAEMGKRKSITASSSVMPVKGSRPKSSLKKRLASAMQPPRLLPNPNRWGATSPKSPDRNNSKPKPFFIVGIGASAGGLEACTELFRNLPADTGMSFVFVQHLDPKHESRMTELLSRRTNIPVSEVTDGMVVEPDHIYIMPPNTDMTISHGVAKGS